MWLFIENDFLRMVGNGWTILVLMGMLVEMVYKLESLSIFVDSLQAFCFLGLALFITVLFLTVWTWMLLMVMFVEMVLEVEGFLNCSGLTV